MYALMLSRAVEIKETIQDITAPYQDLGCTMRWLSSVFNMTSTCDGALAAVLCLATDIELVSLGSMKDLKITKIVLNSRWAGLTSTTFTYPFRKIRTLEMAGCSGCLLPGVETYRIRNMQNAEIHPGLIHMPY